MADMTRIDDDDVLGATLRRLRAALTTDADIERAEELQVRGGRADLLRESGIDEVLTERGVALVVRDELRSCRPLQLVRAWMLGRVPVLGIFGGTGVGKTLAAAWGLAQRAGRYVEADPLTRMRREHFGAPSRAYRQLLRTELLVIDELGTEEDEPAARAMLHDVVNRRQRLPRKTLLLGNLTAAEFRTRYDKRTLDRLEEPVGVLRSVQGESMRGSATE